MNESVEHSSLIVRDVYRSHIQELTSTGTFSDREVSPIAAQLTVATFLAEIDATLGLLIDLWEE